MTQQHTKYRSGRGPLALAIAAALGTGAGLVHAGEPGNAVGPPVLLLEQPPEETEIIDIWPAVAMDADGDAVVAWLAYHYDDAADEEISQGVYFRRISSSGETGDTVTLSESTDESIDYEDIDVAMDADGDFVVVWSEYEDGSLPSVIAQRFGADGVAAGGPFVVSNAANASGDGTVGMDAAGNFVIAWEDYVAGHVYFRRFSADGTALDATGVQVDTAAINPGDSSIGVGAKGDIVVAWEAYDYEETGIYARRFAADGTPLDADEFLVNQEEDDEQDEAHVAVDIDGDFVVTWSSYMKYGPLPARPLMARRFAADGNPLTDEVFLAAGMAPSLVQLTGLAFDTDGDVTATWIRLNPLEMESASVGVTLDADGNRTSIDMGEEFGACVASSEAGCPAVLAVAMDADGDMLPVFNSLEEYAKYGGGDLQAQRIQGLAEADLAASLSADAVAVTPGSDVVLSVEIENLAALGAYYGVPALDGAIGVAGGVRVDFTLPESFTLASNSEGWTCTATDATHLGCAWSLQLAPAESTTLDVTVTTAADEQNVFPVHMQVSANPLDPDSLNQDGQLAIAVATVADDDDDTPAPSGGGGGGALGWLGLLLLLLPFGVGGGRRRI